MPAFYPRIRFVLHTKLLIPSLVGIIFWIINTTHTHTHTHTHNHVEYQQSGFSEWHTVLFFFFFWKYQVSSGFKVTLLYLTQNLFSSVKLSHWVVSDFCDSVDGNTEASLSMTNSWSLLKLMSFESAMPKFITSLKFLDKLLHNFLTFWNYFCKSNLVWEIAYYTNFLAFKNRTCYVTSSG